MSFFCSHRETTDAVDGEALCVSCGAAVRSGPLTEHEFFNAVAAVYRSPHHKACLRAGDEWVCAPECVLYRA